MLDFISSFMEIIVKISLSFGVCALFMVGIQIYFGRRAKQLNDAIIEGVPVNQETVERAFKAWWVPVERILKNGSL